MSTTKVTMQSVHYALKFIFLNKLPFLKNINHISYAIEDAIIMPQKLVYILQSSPTKLT